MAQTNAATAVSNVFKTPELKDKIVFTLLCLLVYRIGAHITAPGIDTQALIDFFANQDDSADDDYSDHAAASPGRSRKPRKSLTGKSHKSSRYVYPIHPPQENPHAN